MVTLCLFICYYVSRKLESKCKASNSYSNSLSFHYQHTAMCLCDKNIVLVDKRDRQEDQKCILSFKNRI